MHMIGHQAVGPDLYMRTPRGIREQVEIEFIVAILKKRPLPPVPALGHMMRNAGQDETGKAGHGLGLARRQACVNI
jgi:hypothetical protein